MTKNDYFKHVLALRLFNKSHWFISAFSITQEDAEAYRKDPYQGRIISLPTGYRVLWDGEVVPIEDAKAGQPLFTPHERITLTQAEIPSITGSVETSIGNAVFNALALVQTIGTKLPYQQGLINAGKIDDKIAKLLIDDPQEGQAPDPVKIHVYEYLHYCDALIFITEFSHLFVRVGSEKMLLPPPGIQAYKDQLYQQYAATINEPTTLAKIDEALLAYAKKNFENDPETSKFLDTNTNKLFNMAYRKMYLSLGAEAGLTDEVNLKPVKKSLDEGWDLDNFANQNDSLRAGSYYRGVGTEQGGEKTKWGDRATSNLTVQQEDCGTLIGMPVKVYPDNLPRFIGMYHLEGKKTSFIENEDQAKSYLGKVLMMRTPGYCHAKNPAFCRYCVGEALAMNPGVIASEIASYGSVFLGLSLAAFHGKNLNLVRLDWKRQII